MKIKVSFILAAVLLITVSSHSPASAAENRESISKVNLGYQVGSDGAWIG